MEGEVSAVTSIQEIRDAIFRSLQTQVRTKRSLLVAALYPPVTEAVIDGLLLDFANNTAQALGVVGELAQIAGEWVAADALADQFAGEIAALETLRRAFDDQPGTEIPGGQQVAQLNAEIHAEQLELANACQIESDRDHMLHITARHLVAAGKGSL
jgi:hypothetical protein